MPSVSRPNIVLIHSDQHRNDTLGCHGHPLVRTPYMDRLAREGADFVRAFTPSPICSPARACLMTGTWASTHGCLCIPSTTLYRPARRDLPVLSQLVRGSGYRCGMVGKFHQEVEGEPTDHGFETFVPPEGYIEWRKAEGVPPLPVRGNGFREVIDAECPPEKSWLAWQGDRVLETLESLGTGEAPFFVRWDPTEPHLPCRPTAPFAELYPAEKIGPWRSWPDPLEKKPEVQLRQRRIWGVEGWTWEQWQPAVQCYLATITELDAQIGRILAWVDERGVADNTLFIYTTDHGDFCGGHGQFDKHFAMYDDIVQVPLLMRWPGRIEPGRKITGFVSHEIDLARTLVSAAGAEVPETFAGCDLIALARGETPARDDILSQYFGTQSGAYDIRMVRGERFKYVYNPTAFDEFYDLKTDPGEIRNEIANAALSADIARMRGRLVRWMEETRDPLLNLWTRAELESPRRAVIPPRTKRVSTRL